MRRTITTLLTLIFAFTLTACGARYAPAAESEVVSFTITNEYSAPLTVLLATQGGRRMLGQIGASETRTVHFNGPTAAQRFWLVAQADAGAVVSRGFYIPAGAKVLWSVRSNFVRTLSGTK